MKFNWSLRQMFLWVFIVALILPYFAALIPPKINPLTGFTVSEADIQTWLREIDPTVEMFGGGGGSGGIDSIECDFDYSVMMSNATDGELFDHLQKRVQEQIDGELWRVTQSGSSNESFSFVFSNGLSRYRLYFWNVPTSANDRNFAEASGKRAMRIKVLKIGYTSR